MLEEQYILYSEKICAFCALHRSTEHTDKKPALQNHFENQNTRRADNRVQIQVVKLQQPRCEMTSIILNIILNGLDSINTNQWIKQSNACTALNPCDYPHLILLLNHISSLRRFLPALRSHDTCCIVNKSHMTNIWYKNPVHWRRGNRDTPQTWPFVYWLISSKPTIEWMDTW